MHLAVGGGLAIYSAWREVPIVTAGFFFTAFITFILHHLASVDPGFLEVNESGQASSSFFLVATVQHMLTCD